MVFSFFKKDPKDPKKRSGTGSAPAQGGPRTGGGATVQTRPLPKPVSRPVSGPATRAAQPNSPSTVFARTETALPDRDRARSRAMETAAKIDQIESEMARDMLRGLGRTTGAPQQPAAPTPAPVTAPVPAAPPVAAEPTADEARELAETLTGDIDAIEINTSGAGSVIDETAILFSNGQADEAESVLRAGLRAGDMGPSTRLAWRMLFELVNQRADKISYDKLTVDYVARFEHAAPAWHEYAAAQMGHAGAMARPAAGSPAVQQPGASHVPGICMPPKVDAGIVKDLEQLRGLTATHPVVQLDLSAIAEFDAAGADLLLRVVNAFKKSNRGLILPGAEQCAALLQRSIEPGRRDPSDSPWLLLLELLRILGRQNDFEETAIHYCVTFEMSPPSWETAPAQMKAAPPTAGTNPAVQGTAPTASGAPLELRGIVEGEGEPHFGRLLASARERKEIIIDCLHLRRMAFSAASAFLPVIRRLQQGGATVELRNVNALVAALLHLLGITAVVTVHARRT